MERPTALFLTHTIPPLRKRRDLWAKCRAEHRWERPASGHTSYNIWDEHNHTHSAAGVFCPKEPWPHWKPYKHRSLCIHLLFFSGWCIHTNTKKGRGLVSICSLSMTSSIAPYKDVWEWPGVLLFRKNRFSGAFFFKPYKMYRIIHLCQILLNHNLNKYDYNI